MNYKAQITPGWIVVANAEEIVLDVGGVVLAGKRWRNGSLPVLALHGWLDNAASFDRIAPLLQGADVVALDLAGHGYSYHRTPQAAYNIWEDLPDILRAADRLGWQQFHVIGHSRGAIIASLLTVTLSERVLSTALLDGFRPDAVPYPQTFTQLAQFLREHLAIADKPRVRYETLERALEVRSRVSGMRAETALPIVERGLQCIEGLWTWRADPRLHLPSAIKLSPEQVQLMQAELAKKHCKLWLAERGMVPWLQQGGIDELHFAKQIMPGSHHFHMEEQAEILAREIVEFWQDCEI
ncbi:MAG: alpha/beta hydrolase [Spongiibacteraceae bacterium]